MSVPGTPVQGTSAFVYVEPESGALQLFDFVSVNERSAGFKVHLQKDRLLNGMSTLNLIFEQMERFVLAEPTPRPAVNEPLPRRSLGSRDTPPDRAALAVSPIYAV